MMSYRNRGVWPLLIHVMLAGYWITLFTATHIPHPETLVSPNISDKLIHCGAYVVLTLFARWSRFFGLLTVTGWQAVGWTFAVLAGYGILEELTQAPFGRTPQVSDFLADMSGVTVGLLLWYRLERSFPGWCSRQCDSATNPENDSNTSEEK